MPRGECIFLRLFYAPPGRESLRFFHAKKQYWKGGIAMTLNLLFVTLTLKKKRTSFEEATHNESVSKHFEETKTRQQHFTSHTL
ncbi:YrzI family small protein [Rossellomorea marisflavi]|uniref:YrzI family small protein n=1 Tax=Rossellomorea marisflavi TaxID=189381 RepID=A0A5D4S1R2_9BACI|nr:YrzI family small protein [Rossellomorea marisflavi]